MGCVLLVLTFGASSALAAPLCAGRVRRNGHNVVGNVSDCTPLLELGSSDNGLGLGRANRSQYFLALSRARSSLSKAGGSAFGRRGSLPGDDDLAMGSQGDFRGLFCQVRDDDGGARNAFIAHAKFSWSATPL